MQVRNTYTGGLERDISLQAYPADKLYDSMDFRIVSDDGLATGTKENIRGNSMVIDIISYLAANQPNFGNISTNTKVIGSCLIRDELILFAVDELSANQNDYIIKLDYDSNNALRAKVIWSSYSTTAVGRLNFSTSYPIYDAIGRYENSKIKKIYFTDNNYVIRYCNIYELEEDMDTNGFSTMPSNSFDSMPTVELPKPILVNVVTGGSLNAGVINYYYQFYSANGAASALSPGSGNIHLTDKSETIGSTPFSILYLGAPQGTNTGKAVQIEIVNNNLYFTRIRIISCFFETINAEPAISIIYEGEINTNNIYIDDGTIVLGTLTIEEFAALLNKNMFVCKSIESKNNYLFAANIKEEILDTQQIRDFDTRVYRYNIVDTAILYEDSVTSGKYYKLYGSSGMAEYWENGVMQTTYPNWSIPEDADVINPMNNVADDATLVTANLYQYNDLGDIGASGKNIRIRTKIKQIVIREQTGNQEYIYTAPTQDLHSYNGQSIWNESYTDYGSPMINALFKGYQRGEIYRLGMRFIDSKGRRSYVKWMCDFRMPFPFTTSNNITYYYDGVPKYDYSIIDVQAHYYNSSGTYINMGAVNPFATIKANVLGLELEFKCLYSDIPDDPFDSTKKCKIEIMRVKRNANNRSILCAGPIVGYNEKMTGYFIDALMSAYSGGTDDGVYYNSYTPNYQQSMQMRTYSYQECNSGSYPIGLQRLRMRALYSPEISYFKNIDVNVGDKLMLAQAYFASFGVSHPDPARRTIHNVTKSYPLSYVNGMHPQTYVNTGSSYADLEREILDGTTIPYYHDGQSYSIYNNSITFSNGVRGYSEEPSDSLPIWGQLGTHIAMYLNSPLWMATPIANFHDYGGLFTTMYGYIKRPLVKQYGGNTYTGRSGNTYITTGAIRNITNINNKTEIYGGDIYICMWGFYKTMAKPDSSLHDYETMTDKSYMPVETTINLPLHDSDYNARTFLGTSYNLLLQEKSDVWNWSNDSFTQLEDMYIYNSVYSREEDINTGISMPIDFIRDVRNDVMVLYSGKKYNGELFDNWLDYKVNDFIEVDSKYGPINKIILFHDKLISLQDKAVGLLSVQERALISDTSGMPLGLGTGTILDRYDYYSILSGTKHQPSAILSNSGLMYYDALNNAIMLLSKGDIGLTDIKGLKSLLKTVPASIKDNDNPFVLDKGTVLAFRDKRYKEILFSFVDNKRYLDGNGQPVSSPYQYTLSYNELLNVFSDRYSFVPDIYIEGIKNNFFTMKQSLKPMKTYQHNIGLRGVFYEQTPTTCYITMVINPNKGYICLFNNLSWVTEVFDSLGVDIYDLTLTGYEAWNHYQSTGYVTLTKASLWQDGSMAHLMRKWYTYIARDNSPDDPRMRDGYMFIKFYFQNQNDIRLLLHDIQTSITAIEN